MEEMIEKDFFEKFLKICIFSEKYSIP